MFCLFLFLSSLSCRETEPQLQAVEKESLILKQKINQKKESRQKKEYQKPASVYIDFPYFGGRSYQASKGFLAEQFGRLQESSDLPMGRGTEYRFEKGVIQVLDDEIYMLQADLPESLRRNQALQILGFPEQIDNYIITHREYIVEHQWEFLRFRMKRDSTENELVTSFEAWKWDPKKR